MMALPMNSLYSLTWGDYGTSLVSAIQLLRCHGDLVDCTLAAGGRSFPAHKIVLCAASPFLLDLLKNTPCKHPVVMLAGVNANDLEALLEFVYRGEVSVDHAQLPSLLQAAQCLNIQGLAPQTVTKDDYTHSIQLQHMIPQHHHEQEQLIATIATAPQQTVHAQVVDDIHQAGQILQTTTQTTQGGQQQTIVTTDATKDVIQQYLPARKRKPRTNKKSPTAPKITKVEGMETIISTPTTSHTTTTVQTTQQQQQQVQQQQQQQQQQIENGNDGTMITSTPIIKSEVTKVETIVMDPNTSGEISISTPGKTGKRTKNLSGEKPRSRSQSEQPATCPICYAVIRQSRNLRRHLELRHFAKPGVKKEKKTPGKKTAMAVPPGSSNASGTSTVTTTSAVSTVPQVQSVQSLHTLQTVQVKKDPDAQNQGQQTMTVTTTTTGNNNGQQQQQQQNQQQQNQQQQTQQQVQQVQVQQTQQIQQHHIIDQSGNISTTTTTTTAGQQQQQQQAQQQQQQQQQQNQQQAQQIVTQTENTDGTTSLSIAQVQTLPSGHQILGNINQVNMTEYQTHPTL
ncbi:trithorax-like isoform X2 [Musca autumnalis]|uniref:trithorax-like isoform X2 n=1 Tax=Musca autumnalis TaxID=221902 RepID=UPI003CED5CE7